MSTRKDERRLVDLLNRHQIAKLAIHSDDRVHWREWGDDGFYLTRMREEIGELMAAIAEGQTPAQVWREAADVANFSAMLADRYLKRYAEEAFDGDERKAMAVLP